MEQTFCQISLMTWHPSHLTVSDPSIHNWVASRTATHLLRSQLASTSDNASFGSDLPQPCSAAFWRIGFAHGIPTIRGVEDSQIVSNTSYHGTHHGFFLLSLPLASVVAFLIVCCRATGVTYGGERGRCHCLDGRWERRMRCTHL